MAFAARRFNVLGFKNRLFPCERAVVRLRDRGCGALSAVADGAAELVELVRNRRMRAKWLSRNVSERGFFQPNVATRAAIDDSEIWQPYLLNAALEVPLQSVGLAAVANHAQISVLVVPPLAEEILRRGDGQRREKNHADHTECADAIAEQRLPDRSQFFSHVCRVLRIKSSATAVPRPNRVLGRMYRWL